MDRVQFERYNVSAFGAGLNQSRLLRRKCFHIADANSDPHAGGNRNADTNPDWQPDTDTHSPCKSVNGRW
jgi:hypothetical protein